jgi:hypothetical protein
MKVKISLVLVVLLCLISYQSNAQKLGVKGGLSIAKVVADELEDLDNKMNLGFHAGLSADVPIAGVASLETGIVLTTKGSKFVEEGDDYEFKIKINTLYLDIPLRIKATTSINDGLLAYGAFGPYMGIGLSGKTKFEDTYGGQTDSETEDIEWGNDEENDHLRRLDYGLSFGGGVIFKGIEIGLNYDLGLANISAYRADDSAIKNRVLRITVGYKFGGK